MGLRSQELSLDVLAGFSEELVQVLGIERLDEVDCRLKAGLATLVHEVSVDHAQLLVSALLTVKTFRHHDSRQSLSQLQPGFFRHDYIIIIFAKQNDFEHIDELVTRFRLNFSCYWVFVCHLTVKEGA